MPKHPLRASTQKRDRSYGRSLLLLVCLTVLCTPGRRSESPLQDAQFGVDLPTWRQSIARTSRQVQILHVPVDGDFRQRRGRSGATRPLFASDGLMIEGPPTRTKDVASGPSIIFS